MLTHIGDPCRAAGFLPIAIALQCTEFNCGCPTQIGDFHHGLLEEAVEYVLGDCFFAVGQTVGMRKTIDYDAVIWWHDHFRSKFLAAMRHHGNRWLQDRDNVTAVGWMLAERAVRHTNGRSSIDVKAACRAAADVERYCEARSKRAARSDDQDTGANPRLAGYWCIGWEV